MNLFIILRVIHDARQWVWNLRNETSNNYCLWLLFCLTHFWYMQQNQGIRLLHKVMDRHTERKSVHFTTSLLFCLKGKKEKETFNKLMYLNTGKTSLTPAAVHSQASNNAVLIQRSLSSNISQLYSLLAALSTVLFVLEVTNILRYDTKFEEVLRIWRRKICLMKGIILSLHTYLLLLSTNVVCVNYERQVSGGLGYMPSSHNMRPGFLFFFLCFFSDFYSDYSFFLVSILITPPIHCCVSMKNP